MRAVFTALLVVFVMLSAIPVNGEAEKDFKRAIHTIIKINSDADFTSQNGVVGGSGTQSDPYIIEGWEIDAQKNGYCIFIANTTVYFIIRNCTLLNASYQLGSSYDLGGGIIIMNSTHGVIENCVCKNNYMGILITESDNITVSDTECSLNTYNIGVYESESIVIKNTTAKEGAIGIQASPKNITIDSCKIIHNSNYGLYINGKDVCVSNSIIEGNGNGIYAQKWDSSELHHNYIANNTGYGIKMVGCVGNIIYFNRFYNNADYAVELTTYTQGPIPKFSRYNRFYWNSFLYNHGTNETYNPNNIQVKDDSGPNYWNKTYLDGNYWRDWAENNETNDQNGDGIVDYPYMITANYSSGKDYKPLGSIRTKILEPLSGIYGNIIRIKVKGTQRVYSIRVFIDGSLLDYSYSNYIEIPWDSSTVQDGNHTIKAIGYDVFGNSMEDSVEITVDNTLPKINVFAPSDGDVFISGEIVEINANATDNYGLNIIKLFIDGNEVYNTSSSNLSYRWDTHNISEGNHTLKIEAIDLAGNVNYTTIRVYIIVDDEPPTSPTLISPYDGSYVYDENVTFVWNASYDISSVSYILHIWKGYEITVNTTNTSITVNLSKYFSSVEGEYYWMVEALDFSGNMNQSVWWKFIVDLDPQPPVIDVKILNSKTFNGIEYITKNVSLMINATDYSGISSMNITVKNASCIAYTTGWISYEKYHNFTLNLSSEEGIWIIVEVMDNEGSVSNTSVYAYLDLYPPIFYLNYSDVIFCPDTKPYLNISINAQDTSNITDMFIGLINQTPVWIPYSPNYSLLLPDSEGKYKIKVMLRDPFNHTSSQVISVLVVKHRPSGEVFYCAWSNDGYAHLQFHITDYMFNITEMMISLDENFTDGVWLNYKESYDYKLPTTEGLYTIYIKFRNEVGIESDIYNVSVGYDATPPSSELSSLSQYTNSSPIVLYINSQDSFSGVDLIEIYWRINGGLWKYYLTVDKNTSYIEFVPSKDGVYEFSSVAKDIAKNSEELYSKCAVVYDTSRPSLHLNISNVVEIKDRFDIDIGINATDNLSGVKLIKVFVESSAGEKYNFTLNSTKLHLELNDNTTYKVNIFVYDYAGNFVNKSVVIVVDYNWPPTIVDYDVPENVVAGEETAFFVNIYDPDNDTVTCMWYLDGQLVGTGKYLKINIPKGVHNLTLEITDGKNVKRYYFTIKSTEKMNLTIIFLAIILALIVAVAILAVILLSRRKPKEISEEEEKAILREILQVVSNKPGIDRDGLVKEVRKNLKVPKEEVAVVLWNAQKNGYIYEENGKLYPGYVHGEEVERGAD